MALLKAVIAKLDDVDEGLRGFYVAKGDKFELQVEGMKTPGDVAAVQEALRKEREGHAATKAAGKETADKLAAFGEVTPEQVTAQAEKLANFEAAGTPELTKNFEKIVTDRVASQVDARVKTETAKLQKAIGDLNTQLGTVSQENEKFKTTDKFRTIDDSVRAAATKGKVLDGAVPDALIHARGVFDIVDGKVVTSDGQTPEDWIESRKTVSGHWWPGARGAGGGGGGDGFGSPEGDNPWTVAGWNLTKQGQMVRAEPDKAARLAQVAGVKIGATAPLKPAK